MAFAVLHSTKGSSSGGGLGNHIDRVEGKEHTYPGADPARSKLNFSWNANEHCQTPMYQGIKNRIEEGYTGKRKIRADAVTHLTHILSGSHERMKEIENDPELFKKWVNENAHWAKKEFGQDNIIRFVVHRDEKTPHIHLVTVPLTEDGRLSAKEIMGNKKKMTERQTSYAFAMEKFGLERGKSSDKNHLSTKQWEARKEIEMETKDLYRFRDEARGKFFDIANMTIGKMQTSIKELKKGIDKEIEKVAKKKDKGIQM